MTNVVPWDLQTKMFRRSEGISAYAVFFLGRDEDMGPGQIPELLGRRRRRRISDRLGKIIRQTNYEFANYFIL